MAGSCTAGGIGLDGDGNVILLGATEKVWPNEGNCPIAENNGLHFDPETGYAWIPPRVAPYNEIQFGVNKTIAPTNDTTKQLGKVTLEHKVGPCGLRQVVAEVGGGYAGFRLASGNFWLLNRTATLYVDGAPVYATGLETVAAHENNSGGVTSQTGPIEMTPYGVVLDPGQTVKIEAVYTLELPNFTANGLNSFVFRPPPIRALFLPVPT